MPTPPKESIGGSRPHQIFAFNFAKVTYDYLLALEDFTLSEEFGALDETEQDLIQSELSQQSTAYEILWQRVEEY